MHVFSQSTFPKFFLALGLMLLALCGVARAENAGAATEAPDALVRRVSGEVMDIARSDKAIQAGDRKRIYEVVQSKILPHLDFQRGTALTMGRYWREATPEQRQRVSEEFRNLLLHTYAGAMSQIRDQTIEFKPMRLDPDATNAEVHSEVKLPRRPEPVQVSYRLHKTSAGWKIYDVNVMGAWLSETYKATFSSEISRGGVDGLIRTLEDKNRQLAAKDSEPAARQ
jgi:phospholipid transport system substrate-binding protein